MWLKIMIFVMTLLIVMAAANRYGTKRWQASTQALYTGIESVCERFAPTSYNSHELEGLPAPVQRYFRTVLQAGQPVLAAASIKHSGTFNMGKSDEQWKPFTSTQRVITRRPGFVWDARIRLAPAITVRVHDAYVAGEGVLNASLFGLISVMKQPSTPELAQGELLRFFAESAWYPTALLPSQGVVWEAIDDTQARATLTDDEITVKLVIQFDAQGLISSVRSDERYREVGGKQVPTPWQGRFWNYERRDGMLVPLDGEVAWLLPEGEKPYWRGRIQYIEYEYAHRTT